MRIICGAHKGKRIIAPESLPVRPTTDMAKESLFNVLNNYFYFDGIEVLDLFAGTGNISYEFAARGAVHVLAVDINAKCVDFISKTSKNLNFENLTVIKAETFQYIKTTGRKFNVIFADPPYDMEGAAKLPDAVFDRNLLKEDGWFVLEHSERIDFSQHPNFFQMRKYGRVHFSAFINVEKSEVME
ncbi:MAG: RsmD family RNA methyltransferase [Bacteroidota bacterium]